MTARVVRSIVKLPPSASIGHLLFVEHDPAASAAHAVARLVAAATANVV